MAVKLLPGTCYRLHLSLWSVSKTRKVASNENENLFES
ncbi:hypothetical protein SP38_43 [Salmonella phage 38]|uniref:Uncharacterized protein n=1 Tax=Salmonella phage 38 TaxID=1654891 RepID=A0A0N7CE19_9CAUD|nr:hypothetical protein SP38_43 [Salmonella phage 38]AKJ73645.1 hypothetical protein SP38_43 [Salmonella phage 38]